MKRLLEGIRNESGCLWYIPRDWLVCWQGTKACLGWDREPSGATFACTTVTDSWLILLQKSLQAAKALQSAPGGTQEAGTVAEAAQVAASYIGSFQELLDQLLNHWQASFLFAESLCNLMNVELILLCYIRSPVESCCGKPTE